MSALVHAMAILNFCNTDIKSSTCAPSKSVVMITGKVLLAPNNGHYK